MAIVVKMIPRGSFVPASDRRTSSPGGLGQARERRSPYSHVDQHVCAQRMSYRDLTMVKFWHGEEQELRLVTTINRLQWRHCEGLMFFFVKGKRFGEDSRQLQGLK